MKKKIIVVGAGYGGLRTVEYLAKSNEFEILLIDKNPYHYLQTEVYGYIAGKFDINEIVIDLENWCKGFQNKVTFLKAEASNVNFEEKTLLLGNDTLNFDYLILATGAYTNFFSFIPGLRENSFGVKKLEMAYNFRKKFENLIHDKLQNSNNNEEVNIAIGGAGLSGVEVAAEMAHVIKAHCKTIGTNAQNIKIYLIDASDTILPGMTPYAIKHTKKRLEDLNVKILTSAFINKVDEKNIYFKDGDKLEYAFMIFTGGIKASDITNQLPEEKNKLNQLIPNEYLNIKDTNYVFGIGDCVEIKDKYNKLLPPTAQIAENSAQYVATSIINIELGKEVDKFDTSVKGVFIALGGKYAVGEVFTFIKVKGYWAYLLKKAIATTYFMGLNLRINAGYKNRNKNEKNCIKR